MLSDLILQRRAQIDIFWQIYSNSILFISLWICFEIEREKLSVICALKFSGEIK